MAPLLLSSCPVLGKECACSPRLLSPLLCGHCAGTIPGNLSSKFPSAFVANCYTFGSVSALPTCPRAGLSQGAIAGIVIGSFFGLLLLILCCIFCFCFFCKRNRDTPKSPHRKYKVRPVRLGRCSPFCGVHVVKCSQLHWWATGTRRS